MAKIRVTGIFKAIEQWAAESHDRAQLLIILVWLAFSFIVLASILIAAWIMLPADFF